MLQGLQRTLFERVHRLYGESVAAMLTVQYRMHASIMSWASEEMYKGALQAHASVAEHTLQDLQVHTSIAPYAKVHLQLALLLTLGHHASIIGLSECRLGLDGSHTSALIVCQRH